MCLAAHQRSPVRGISGLKNGVRISRGSSSTLRSTCCLTSLKGGFLRLQLNDVGCLWMIAELWLVVDRW